MKTELLISFLGAVVALGALGIAIFSHYVFIRRFSGINTKFLEISKDFTDTQDKINGLFTDTQDKIKDLFTETHGNIKKLTESVQTRKIKEFPNNMEEVIKLINSAKKSIEIYADLTCWGIYSKPDLFAKYAHTLLNIKADSITEGEKTVHIYTYNEECTQKEMDIFFNSENTLIEKIKESPYAKHLKEQKNHQKYEKFENIKTIEEFTKYMTDEEMEFKTRLDDSTFCETYENKRIGIEIPYYMWIKDGTEAIIDLPYFYPYNKYIGTENSIQTFDKDLIEIFKNFLDVHIKGNIE